MNLNEALDIFEPHLNDIKVACEDNMQDVLMRHPKPELTGWEELDTVKYDVWQKEVKQKIAPLHRVHSRIVNREQRAISPRVGRITQDQIDRAKEYPIIDLYEEMTGEWTRHGMALCPFHDDHTPSFSMRRYNRFKCFGCDEKGSVIDLCMKLGEMTFKEAVRKLS